MDADEEAEKDVHSEEIASTVEEMRQRRLAYFNGAKSKPQVNQWEIQNPLSTQKVTHDDLRNGHLEPMNETKAVNRHASETETFTDLINHSHMEENRQTNLADLSYKQATSTDFKQRIENPKRSQEEPQHSTRQYDFLNSEPQPLRSRKGKFVHQSVDSDLSQLQLKDSENDEAMSIFGSHPDLGDLGLSTHRPESEASVRSIPGELYIPTNHGSAKTTKQIFSEKAQEEMRLALGEEKMDELMQKVNSDIGQLRHQNRSPRRRQRLSDDSRIAKHEQNGTGISRSSSVDSFSPVVSSDHPISSYRSRAGSQSPLRQPMSKVAVNIKDGEREVPVLVRNYDQIPVPKNTRNSFSSEEIYRQAYGGFQESDRLTMKRWSNSNNQGYVVPQECRVYPVSGRGRKSSGENNAVSNTMSSASHFHQNYNAMFSQQSMPTMPLPHLESQMHNNSVPNNGHNSFRGQQGGNVPIFGAPPYPHPPNIPPPFYQEPSNANSMMYNPYGSQSPSGSPSNMLGPQHNTFYYPPSHFGSPQPRFPENMPPFNIHHPPPISHQMLRQSQPQMSFEQSNRRNSLSLHGYPQGNGDENISQEMAKQIPAALKMPHPPANPPAISRYEDSAAKTRHGMEDRHCHGQSEQRAVRVSEKDFNSFNLQRYFSSIDLSPENVGPDVAPATPHSSRSMDGDFPKSHNDDNMSAFTNGSEFTSVTKAGGITNRLLDLGVNLDHLKHLWVVDSKNDADQKNDDAILTKLIRRCPECGTANKTYMTWCIECSESLIGVDPSLPRGKQRQSRTSNVEHESTANDAMRPSRSSESLAVDSEHEDGGGYFRKDSPESGRGISLSSSPVRYRRDLEETAAEPKDSGRASIGDAKEGAMQILQEVRESADAFEDIEENEEVEYIYEDVEADIYEQISDPILRDFIISYRNRQELNMDPILNSCVMPEAKSESAKTNFEHESKRKWGWRENESTEGRKLSDETTTTMHRKMESSQLKPEYRESTDFSATDGRYKGASSSYNDEDNPSGGIIPESLADKSTRSSVEDSKQGKSKKKKKKKQKSDPMDIEIFGYEETRQSRSSSRCENVVPMLNLVRSSEEEEESSSEDEESFEEKCKPIIYGYDDLSNNNAKTVESKRQPQTQSSGIPRLGTKTSSKQKTPSREAFKQPPKSSTQATVSKSSPQIHKHPGAQGQGVSSKVNAKGSNPVPTNYQRHWARSSTAWGSYNPRELNTRASIPIPLQQNASNNGSRPSSARLPQRRFNSSEESSSNPSHLPSRPRPASAEYGRRKPAATNWAPSSRPSSATVNARQPNPSNPTRTLTSGSPSAQPSISSQVPSISGNQEDSGNAIRNGAQMNSLSQPSTNGTALPPGNVRRQSVSENDSPRSLCSELHRLPDEEEELPSDKMHAIAKTAYDRFHEMTPRIQEGRLSLWQCLPDEIWLYILSFSSQADLGRLMTVSRGFHRLANDASLWRYITVRPCYSVTDEALGSIAGHQPISLAMVKCQGPNLTLQALDAFFRDTQDRLKELNICGCSQGSLVGSVVLETASKYYRNLTHLDVSYCNIRDKSFIEMVNCADKLESLCVNGFSSMSDAALLTLLKKHGKSLHTLELYACFSLSANVLKKLGDYCVKLRRLCLGGCNKLTDSTMITLSTCLARVEELDLRGCKNVRNDCIRKIVRNCPRISTLVLANCQQISDAALMEMGTYLKNTLRVVDVCGCNLVGDDGIISLAKNCDQLSSLDISSTRCTYRSIYQLAASGCSRWLKTLKLSFLTGLNEASMVNLIRRCHRLKLIHIFGCPSLKNLTKLKAVKPKLIIEGDVEMPRLSFQ